MQRKPIDVGNGGVTASFAADGAWLAVGAMHPSVGLVELLAAPPFLPAGDGDGHAVRSHRRRLASSAYSMLRIADASGSWDSAVEEWTLVGPGWEATAEAWAVSVGRVVLQRYRVRTDGAGALRIVCTARLDCPSFAMITPVGPTPKGLTETEIAADGTQLHFRVPGHEPPIRAGVQVSCMGGSTSSWCHTDRGATLEVSWDSPRALTLDVRVRFGVQEDADSTSAARPSRTSIRRNAGTLTMVSDGSRRYTLECTAVPLPDGTTCLVTDHRLLPLSWTRDAYYQAALLLCYSQEVDLAVVERHLAWLWGRGRDSDGVWQRSHFVSGEAKDPVFQADQQLYPLLELTDFRRVAGRWPQTNEAGHGWGEEVRRVWTSLPRDATGLMPGAENPADDPAEFPYLLSSQLLLAYAARRLAQWAPELGLEDLQLEKQHAELLIRITDAFTCQGRFGSQWAYESDASGQGSLYHDANDVPTACAPMWGLCSPDDLRWRNTMRFAWSEHNPGYVSGRYGGLGSRHTPGVWPLGDAQEWAVAKTIGDRATADRLVGKVRLVASDDGMLPETYDPTTAEWWARSWFAWPGSLVGLLYQTLCDRGGPWVEG